MPFEAERFVPLLQGLSSSQLKTLIGGWLDKAATLPPVARAEVFARLSDSARLHAPLDDTLGALPAKLRHLLRNADIQDLERLSGSCPAAVDGPIVKSMVQTILTGSDLAHQRTSRALDSLLRRRPDLVSPASLALTEHPDALEPRAWTTACCLLEHANTNQVEPSLGPWLFRAAKQDRLANQELFQLLRALALWERRAPQPQLNGTPVRALLQRNLVETACQGRLGLDRKLRTVLVVAFPSGVTPQGLEPDQTLAFASLAYLAVPDESAASRVLSSLAGPIPKHLVGLVDQVRTEELDRLVKAPGPGELRDALRIRRAIRPWLPADGSVPKPVQGLLASCESFLVGPEVEVPDDFLHRLLHQRRDGQAPRAPGITIQEHQVVVNGVVVPRRRTD